MFEEIRALAETILDGLWSPVEMEDGKPEGYVVPSARLARFGLNERFHGWDVRVKGRTMAIVATRDDAQYEVLSPFGVDGLFDSPREAALAALMARIERKLKEDEEAAEAVENLEVEGLNPEIVEA